MRYTLCQPFWCFPAALPLANDSTEMSINTTINNMPLSEPATAGPGPVVSFLGRVAYEAYLMRPLLPTYIHLIVSAVFPIWVASHASLTKPASAAPPKKLGTRKKHGDDDEESEEVSQRLENLSPSDALVFPILAALTLGTLYLLLKYLQDPAWLNWSMNLYFSFIGVYFLYAFISDTLVTVRNLVFPNQYSSRGRIYEADIETGRYVSPQDARTSPLPGVAGYLPLPKHINASIWSLRRFVSTKLVLRLHVRSIMTTRTNVSALSFLALIAAVSLTYVHAFVAKPWPLTNLIGLSFCYGSLQLTSPSTAWTGSLLLGALFIYDIYFVFFTPVMVHVATNLDVPIKLLFPRPDGCILPVGAEEGSAAMEEYLKCLSKKRAMAMLGLGDIVVPGIVMAFALRWDLWRHYRSLQTTVNGARATKTQQVTKAPYRPATGAWGDRLWTALRMQDERLMAKNFKKTYFKATVTGYILGMIVTVGVMQVAQHAQPALLYLVPGVLGGLWLTALFRGEVRLLWNYDENEEAANATDKAEKKQIKDKKHEKDESPSGPEAEDEMIVVRPDSKAVSKAPRKAETGTVSSQEDEYVQKHLFFISLQSPSTSEAKTNEQKTGSVNDNTQKDTTMHLPDSPRVEVPSSDIDEVDSPSSGDEDASHAAPRTTRGTRSRAGRAANTPARSRSTRQSSRQTRSTGAQVEVDEEQARMAKRRRRGGA
jgi:minor histocompatibility antigen H13